jgi:hypothetical protein
MFDFTFWTQDFTPGIYMELSDMIQLAEKYEQTLMFGVKATNFQTKAFA